MLVFIGGSEGLRGYISFILTRNHAYGTLAAPVAALLFFYVLALGVLLGRRVQRRDRRGMAGAMSASRGSCARASGATPARPTGRRDPRADAAADRLRLRSDS